MTLDELKKTPMMRLSERHGNLTVGDLAERLLAVEDALRELAVACADEFCSPKTESGPERCSDDESVFVMPERAGNTITFGPIRRALALVS